MTVHPPGEEGREGFIRGDCGDDSARGALKRSGLLGLSKERDKGLQSEK